MIQTFDTVQLTDPTNNQELMSLLPGCGTIRVSILVEATLTTFLELLLETRLSFTAYKLNSESSVEENDSE